MQSPLVCGHSDTSGAPPPTNPARDIAIDDFGTGYSSLAYLQSLPARVVKIDGSFVHDLAEDPRKQSMIAAMISLSHTLGHRVVAEGVETARELEIVRARGCDEVQGYFFPDRCGLRRSFPG